MVARVELSIDVRNLVRGLERFDAQVAQRATQQALNRTINNMRATGIEQGSAYLGVPARAITKRTSFNVATQHGRVGVRGATRFRLVAEAFAKGRPFNLRRWLISADNTGVIANAWGEQKHYPNLIIGNQTRTVFVLNQSEKGAKRIKRGAWGPGFTHALERPRIAQAIEDTGNERFPGHFASAANFFLTRFLFQ